jgi:predicted nucleic acid-binding protein
LKNQEEFGGLCRTDDEDVLLGADAVHLGEQLVHHTVRRATTVARGPA